MLKPLKTAWNNWRKTHSLRQSLQRHERFWRWLTGALVLLLLLAVSSRAVSPRAWKVDFVPNDASKRRILAQFSFEFEDPVTAHDRQRKAIERAGLYFNRLPEVPELVVKDVEQICAELEKAAQTPAATSEAELQKLSERLQQQFKISLRPQILTQLLGRLPDRTFAGNLKQTVRLIYRQVGIITYHDRELLRHPEFRYNLVLVEGDTKTKINSDVLITQGVAVNREISAHLRNLYPAGQPGAAEFQSAGLEILQQLILPNTRYDEKLTERERELAMQELEPEMIEVRASTILVEKGQWIDEQTAAKLHAYNAGVIAARVKILCGHLTLIICIAAFITAFWRKLLRNVQLHAPNILVAAFPLIVLILVSRIALNLNPLYGGFFYFAGAVGILGVMTLDSRLALMQVVAGAMLLGLLVQSGDKYFFTIFAIVSGFAAVAFVYQVRKRRDILEAGFKIALVNILIYLVLQAIEYPKRPLDGLVLGWVVLNGLFCSLITYPALVISERVCGVLTDLNLLELTGVMHPALRELEDHAPGSYQHTLSVTRLAEAAADEIGANVLLVRAGGVFHDLGKMVKPKYFSENQITEDERGIHAGLSPHMSCLIIKNHVKDGIEIARNYGLPQRVIDFIPQHHGTSLIKYFYVQAKHRYENSESVEPVIEDEFRYPGPKPQTIETAILMLADSVEATATSKLTGVRVKDDDIRRLVHETIEDKFNDGQFNETPLTLRDLHDIGESFVKSLRARYHFRVAYPAEHERPAPKKN